MANRKSGNQPVLFLTKYLFATALVLGASEVVHGNPVAKKAGEVILNETVNEVIALAKSALYAGAAAGRANEVVDTDDDTINRVTWLFEDEINLGINLDNQEAKSIVDIDYHIGYWDCGTCDEFSEPEYIPAHFKKTFDATTNPPEAGDHDPQSAVRNLVDWQEWPYLLRAKAEGCRYGPVRPPNCRDPARFARALLVR